MKKHFDNQLENYPIILIPDGILKLLKFELTDDEVALKLKLEKPKKKIIKKPIKPSKYKSQKTSKLKFSEANGCMIFFVLIISIAAGSTADTFMTGLGVTVLVLAFEFVVFFILGESLIKFEDDVKYIKVDRDPEELKELEHTYENELREYNLEYEKCNEEYQLELDNYESNILNNKNSIRKKLYYEKLKPLVRATRGKPSPKRGLAELKFLEKINSELNGLIFIDMVPQFEWNNSKEAYNPDFTLICEKTGLHIDIEIDEPYTLKDKTPIHFIGGKDDRRNHFFLENNWCIVRFTERQTIQETSECIKTIKVVYENLLEMKSYYSTSLSIESRWTYEESFIMQNKKYREKYLH